MKKKEGYSRMLQEVLRRGDHLVKRLFYLKPKNLYITKGVGSKVLLSLLYEYYTYKH